MKILLLGKGQSIKYIKKYLKHKKISFINAVFEHEYTSKYILADETLLSLNDIDYAIKSPGIPETNKLYLKLNRKFKFICELDLLKLLDEHVKTIVVTGSNGKTTFVSMLNYLLNKAKLKCITCGNSFSPITKHYKKFDKLDYLIIEQSSFQLHNLSLYNPYISLILNLHPNHLDSSYSLNSYYENKKNIYKYQNKNNYFIYDKDYINNVSTNATIIDKLSFPDLDNINEKFHKYKLNIDYIYTIFKVLGIPEKYLYKINDFKTLKYREQYINKKGITFINDSKSTSVESTLFALSNLSNTSNVILIIGGKDKGLNLNKINKYNIKYIISYGELVNKSMIQLKNVIPAISLKEAFNIAYNIKMNNKTILFSPAASSYDQYKNYMDRGKHFDKLVNKL